MPTNMSQLLMFVNLMTKPIFIHSRFEKSAASNNARVWAREREYP